MKGFNSNPVSKVKPLKSNKQKAVEQVAAITAGLTGSLIDLVVLATSIGGSLILFGPHTKNIHAEKQFTDACKLGYSLFKKFKESQFREAISRAASKGFIVKVAKGEYGLTERGKVKASELIPEYKKPEKWNGELWLVTYDIPENQKPARRELHSYLKEIGCGMIQESVFLSIKDPRKWLYKFVNDHDLVGKVIASHLGQDGSIGEGSVQSLINRVFNLKDLEQRYIEWIQQAEKYSKEKYEKQIFSFFAILRDDPVLPSELLPPNWVGERAQNKFLKKFGNLNLNTTHISLS